MSIIIYKQRHFNKQDVNTPRTAYGYVRYIATRTGTMKNEGMGHGLFGRINAGDGLTYFDDYRELARRAYLDTGNGHTYFKSVISLADEDALDAGIFDEVEKDGYPDDRKIDKSKRDGWERYIEKHVSTIAEKNNISIEDLAWTCAIHTKKEHSHAHLVFWDKSAKSREHTVAVDDTAKKRINDLRRTLIKDTFPHKVREYMENRQLAYHSMRDMTAEIIDSFTKDKSEAAFGGNHGIYERLKENMLALHYCFKDKYSASLPVFNKLTNDEKTSLIKAAHELIDTVPAVRMYVDRYVETKLIEDSLYHKNSYSKSGDDEEGWMSEEYRQRQLDKINKYEERVMEKAVETIARRIFNSIKNDIKSDAQLDSTVFCMLTNIVRMFKNMSMKSNLPRGTVEGGLLGELSKDARKERYLRNIDKGFEH